MVLYSIKMGIAKVNGRSQLKCVKLLRERNDLEQA